MTRFEAAVFERDGHQCRLRWRMEAGDCFGPLTYHHLRKASQGGAYTMENGACLCAGHNVWVEDHPYRARGLGMVR